MTRFRLLAAFPLALVSLGLGARAVRAETVNCTAVDKLPFHIWTPGIYCFTQDLEYTDSSPGSNSFSAINIHVDDVVLDLNGHTLRNVGEPTGEWGIEAHSVRNVTIRNGTVRAFKIGIFVKGGELGGCLVEDILADANTDTGIRMSCRNGVVRHNRVEETRSGITTEKDGVRVVDNDVSGNLQAVEVVNGSNVLVAGNRITDALVGIEWFSGTGGKYWDNKTSGVATPFNGPGTDAGGNN